MPITPTEKIWMNGELVDWDAAQIHILTHTLHYGMGVFEGIRAYETADGPGIFRLTEHMERLHSSAKIMMMDLPYSVEELVEATKSVVRESGLPSAYIRPIAYYGYGEMGLNTLPCSVDVAIACWPWGAYLGDDAVTKGVRMKISSWTRHDHNTMPPASKTTGNYVNSSLAKVEALKAGYEEAIMLNGAGLVSECTGENIFVARHGKLITPPITSGALEGITQSTVMAIAEDNGFDVVVGELTRSDLYIAEEMFVCGTAAEVSAVNSVDDRSIPCPGPMTQVIAEQYAQTIRGEIPKYKDWVELGDVMNADASSKATTVAGRVIESVDIFDTTLRDGAQFEGISLSVEDKLRIAEQLDILGVKWIEGGYPQANPKDAEFFARAPTDLHLQTAQLVAFGSTRKPHGKRDSDPTLQALVASGAGTACIVGKSWDFHVTEALGTTLDEGVAMVAESVAFLSEQGMRVFFDAEHCFDGYKANAEFVMRVLEAAVMNGAECLVMCDTNGGSLPHDVTRIVSEVASHFGDDVQLGIHTQNDTGCAVANSIAAVVGGATHLQGTVNGYGERTGNANLMTCIPNLELKMGVRCLPAGRIGRLTSVSRHVSELVNLPPHAADPYVGTVHTYAHKGGLHTSALGKVGSKSYEHVEPTSVGNHTRVLVSDLGGRSGMKLKAEEFGIDLDGKASGELAATVNELEAKGWVFEAADASLELLMRRAAGWEQPYFRVESYRVSSYHRVGAISGGRPDDDAPVELLNEATVKVWIGDERRIAVGEGNGPVDALDSALRTALNGHYATLNDIHLVDYRVRVLDSAVGTEAVTRVLIESADGDETWFTVGVSENVIEASWMALTDAIVFGLRRAD